MSGNVTFQNVVHSLAPRSIAASSRWRGKPCIRARTVTTTKLMLNMMWAMRIVWMPSGKSRPPVSVGTAPGRADEQRQQARAEDDLRRRHRDEDEQVRARPAAELVAGQGERDERAEGVATIVETNATTRLVTHGVAEAGRPNGFSQASSENSPQTKLNRPAGR